MSGSAAAEPARRLTAFLAMQTPKRLGLAVSGGSDSRALLELAAPWAREQGVHLAVATVDHGLRAEAAQEAASVAARCAALGIGHQILHWAGKDRAGNLQANAREARYRLLAAWAGAAGLDAVALAHTRDDQAETVLMRLAREAGVDGLAAMPERFARDGVTFLRPFLHVGREELRAVLGELGQDWSDDPTNDDPAYERVRVRQALALLGPLGITPGALASVAGQMQSVRAALDHQVSRAAAGLVAEDAGALTIDPGLFDQPDEITRRLFSAAIRWIGNEPYPPRRDALARFIAACRNGADATLGGCVARSTAHRLRLIREWRAVRNLQGTVGQVWDGRWLVEGPPGEVRPLGAAGLAACPDWRATGRAREVLLAAPAIWSGDRLLGAPLAGVNGDWSVQLVPDFQTFLLSH